MTIRDLKKRLKKYDDDAQILIDTDEAEHTAYVLVYDETTNTWNEAAEIPIFEFVDMESLRP